MIVRAAERILNRCGDSMMPLTAPGYTMQFWSRTRSNNRSTISPARARARHLLSMRNFVRLKEPPRPDEPVMRNIALTCTQIHRQEGGVPQARR